ncbi:MAG: LytR/AlgR family response regulator transcription factor [Bacteroidota bacterium]
MNINALIVEDEFRVRQVLVKLLKQHCPAITLVGEAENITNAHALIIKHKPDLVFLDIEMPGGNGFDLLSKFDSPGFETIFVTSYGHYAINAIKYSALDYLLKPVIIDELKAGVNKAVQRIESKHITRQYALLKENLEHTNPKKLGVISKGKLHHVNVNEITYIEGSGNYSNIYLTNGERHIVAKTLKDYEEILCAEDSLFARVHKSYIVNIKQISHVEKGEESPLVLYNNIKLEISRRKRQEVLARIAGTS